MESELPPENKQASQDERAGTSAEQKPADPKPRTKSIVGIIAVLDAGIIATLAMLADFSAINGHTNFTIWFFYLAIVNSLGIASYYAIKHWGYGFWICLFYILICITIVPFALFKLSRPANSAQSTADISLQQPTNSAAWLPPEIPKGCNNVIVWFGGERNTYSVPLLSKYPWSFSASQICEMYDDFATNQNPIFKYPSNLYPGEFAETALPPEPPQRIAQIVLGALGGLVLVDIIFCVWKTRHANQKRKD